MARTARVDVPESWYHVIARGHHRRSIFLQDSDFHAYVECLAEAVRRFDMKLGAFCLMPNHVHLFVWRGARPLGEAFRSLHGRFARRWNLRNRKEGYVFQGRFKSFLISDEGYLATLMSYIHQSPVRAGLCARPSEYAWSSDGFYRSGRLFSGLTLSTVPGYEGDEGRRRYREQVLQPVSDLPVEEDYSIEHSVQAGRKNRRARVVAPKKRSDRRGLAPIDSRVMELAATEEVTQEELRSASRNHRISPVRGRLMVELYREGYSPTVIGDLFARTASAVLKAVNKSAS